MHFVIVQLSESSISFYVIFNTFLISGTNQSK